MPNEQLTRAATALSKIHPEGLDLAEAVAWSQATAWCYTAGRLAGIETHLARLVDAVEGESFDRLAGIVACLSQIAQDLERQSPNP